MDVVLEGSTIHLESETYVGLSITGPAALVEKVRARLDKDDTLPPA
jgi:hypothetical protein